MVAQWISDLGIYLGPVILFVIEIAVGLILLLRRTSQQYKMHSAVDQTSGEAVYLSMISGSLSNMHVLVEHATRRPLFATKNLEDFLHIPWDSLFANLDAISIPMGSQASRLFWNQYNSWDQQSAIQSEFYLTSDQKWIRLTVTVCPDPSYDLFEFQDITEEKQKEQELKQQLDAAESVSQSKTTFLSRMSHEIRTPMNGICGMLTLIGAQPHNEIIEQYLQKASHLSNYLLSLINDILDISRIENGKMELEQKAFDLFDVVNELRDMFQKTTEAKHVRFIVETFGFQSHIISGDRLRFTQILINFISNAVKFTSEGEVRVTFREMMRDESSLSLMVRVHDTGKGMDPAFIKRIFRPFEQENASIATNYGGSGLGMAITEQIVHLMGGEIVIDTLPGKGSDFTVYLTFPLADASELITTEPAKTTSQASRFVFKGHHILLAEDNDINAEIADAILKQRGATLDLAKDGQEVLDLFSSQPAGTYDLILMDIQMPVYDGREATRRIRAMDREDAKRIPIFALSADAFVEDERLSIEAGMNGHFAKPLDFDVIENGIDQFMRGRTNV